MKHNLVYYTKDNAYVTDPYGRRVLNPVPRERRQRRQTIAGVIKDGKIYFGRAECMHTDIFRKDEGLKYASEKALTKTLAVIDLPEDYKIIRVFMKQARKLVIPEKKYNASIHETVFLSRVRDRKPKRAALHAVPKREEVEFNVEV